MATLLGFHLGITVEDDLSKDVIGQEILEEFLIKENVLTLCASIAGDQKQLKFYSEVRKFYFNRVLFSLFCILLS